MIRTWLVAIFYDMIDVSAVNRSTNSSNCIVKLTRFLARKEEESFWFASEKNLLEYQLLCQRKKNCAMQPQSYRKRSKAIENQPPRQKKQKRDAIFFKEAKIENAAPVIRTFTDYICMDCNHWWAESIIQQFSKRFETVNIDSQY